MSVHTAAMRARLLEQAYETFLDEGHSMRDTEKWNTYRERVLDGMNPESPNNPNPSGKKYRA
ncbi:MAG: hypothetical protein HYW26_04500 [Candidatus Aenigmarchaeota archaeon]|nr:hypothetical protein [Candidatus Aenigmarchaeota archaeon]